MLFFILYRDCRNTVSFLFTLNSNIMNTTLNSIDGITFSKGTIARVLIIGQDIREQIAKHRGVAFVSSEIGLARYDSETGEWFVKPRSLGYEIEAMPGTDLDFHQEYLTEATQDQRMIFPPDFNFEAFNALKSKIRADRAKLLSNK